MEADKQRINSYTWSEGKTKIGQSVEFTCHPDDRKLVKEFLVNSVRSIDVPCAKRMNIQHGGYGRYTRYDISQHEYASNGVGYIEILEIKNPPDSRNGFVIFDYNYIHGSHFTEWENLESAIKAFKTYWNSSKGTEIFLTLPGFERKVECGALSPWFYAVGDEVLIGDYTFPDGLQDDPFYKFGEKFVVPNSDGIPSIKTCMGTRFIEKKDEYDSKKIERYRLIYWSDGTVFDERNQYPQWSSKAKFITPKLLKDTEMWIVDAMEQFQKLLAGDSAEFSINFLDGNKFIGKFSKSNPKTKCAAGRYYIAVNIKGKDGFTEGWVDDFVPTPEYPDIISLVTQKYKEKGKIVERIEIKDSKTLPGGKKWSGVYYKKD